MADGDDKERIRGWVRNTPNHAVEVVAEGPESSINAFIELVKKGSPLSRVDKVDLMTSEKLEHFKTFEIRN
ncbi:acylphosphatase [Terrilactibacillus sp. S3-3]|nr:acylphosphatase [Terrilactibacillus sp. S3-3]